MLPKLYQNISLGEVQVPTFQDGKTKRNDKMSFENPLQESFQVEDTYKNLVGDFCAYRNDALPQANDTIQRTETDRETDHHAHFDFKPYVVQK